MNPSCIIEIGFVVRWAPAKSSSRSCGSSVQKEKKKNSTRSHHAAKTHPRTL
jgi:hypothetical protein